MATVNKQISRTFRRRGLSLSADAAQELRAHVDFLFSNNVEESLSAALDRLVQLIKQKSPNSLVTGQTVRDVLSNVEDEKHHISQSGITVVDAFATPKFEYEFVHKVFKRVSEKGTLHASAGSKSQMFKQRYELIKQRVLRHFESPSVGRAGRGRARGRNSGKDEEEEEDASIQITEIGALLGRSGEKCILGMLTQMSITLNGAILVLDAGCAACGCVQQKEGVYFIEDPHDAVQIDLSQASVMPGLFTECCVVLAQGELVENAFVVHELGFPPVESADACTKVFPNLSMFGLPQFKPGDKTEMLLRGEDEDPESHMIVIAADVWLDKPQVMSKLKVLFEGLADSEVRLWIFMGNFTSERVPTHTAHVAKLRGCFDELANLIHQFPSIALQSEFVFIPGPSDPGYGNVLPRPGLSPLLTQRLNERLKKVTFASNPCRILYNAQEIVLFRENLLHKMRRNLVLPANLTEAKEYSEHLVHTVCSQAHLCPLPPVARPVYWQYDHALALNALPDALVLADEYEQFEHTVPGTECTAINPGQFATDYSFVVYKAWGALPQQSDEVLPDADASLSYVSRAEFSRVQL